MHELYKLEKTAREGYESYNFPKGISPLSTYYRIPLALTRCIVINALNNFANTTLSSLYFDITKDCLYANDAKSLERRAVVTVLEQV
jgi:isoleucyl-tRNA synthetase